MAQSQTPTLTTAPAQISADDTAYLRRVLDQVQRGQQLEREAQQFDQQASDRRQQALRLYGAHESFVVHLCEKYDLDSQADQIDPETGAITRGGTPEQGSPGVPSENGTA